MRGSKVGGSCELRVFVRVAHNQQQQLLYD